MKNILLRVGAALLVLGAAVAGLGWYKLFRQEPVRFDSDEEHFKYGSIGVEASQGFPYLVWKALPVVFADRLPGGFPSLGFIFEQGHDLPVGLSKEVVGFPRVGINCALCHVGAYRTAPDAPRILARGAPATMLDVPRYLAFLSGCADDPRFTADGLLPEMEKVQPLGAIDRALYRFIVIPQVKKALAQQKAANAWMDSRPPTGPGRIDPFTGAKLGILHLPDTGEIGNADIVATWNWKRRDGFSLHSDGVNTSLREIVLNSGIGNGASAKTIDIPSLDRIQHLMEVWDPVPWPFPMDQPLAKTGEAIYHQHCASCHDFGQPKTGQPVPIAEIGTDRSRFDSFTPDIARGFNDLTIYPWRYSHFRKTDGYVSPALDGVWLRAPFLHNGSVPTLEDLLQAPAARPPVFYRGYDVYDQQKVGFVSDGPEAEKAGFRFDTSVKGNSNQGHTFGSDLPAEEKHALLEYLKTL